MASNLVTICYRIRKHYFSKVSKWILLEEIDLKEQLKEIKERLGEYDAQLNHIYDVIENLLDEKAAKRKWDERERIGFKK